MLQEGGEEHLQNKTAAIHPAQLVPPAGARLSLLLRLRQSAQSQRCALVLIALKGCEGPMLAHVHHPPTALDVLPFAFSFKEFSFRFPQPPLTSSGLRLAPPFAREEAQKNYRASRKIRPAVKGAACGCQQAKAKQKVFKPMTGSFSSASPDDSSLLELFA